MRDLFPSFINKALYLTDTLVLLSSILLAWYHKAYLDAQFTTGIEQYLLISLIVLPVFLLMFYLFDLYSSQRGQSFSSELKRIVVSNIAAFMIILAFFYVCHLFFVSRALMLYFLLINTLLMSISRYSLRQLLQYFRGKGFNSKAILLIGAGDLGIGFLNQLHQHPEYGYRVVGILDDDSQKQGLTIFGAQVLGKLQDLTRIIDEYHLVEAAIALPLGAYPYMSTIIETCERQGIRVMIIPDYTRYLPPQSKVMYLAETPLIVTREIPLDIVFNRVMKRCFDIIIALLMLILISPLLLLITIGIKLSSPGPVIFKQKRVGLNRRTFTMYKFRSMAVQAESTTDSVWTVAEDPRRTWFGKFIRVLSLDELPQLYNVLRGEMSLIGPRPERPHFVDQFKEEIPNYMLKHQVKPGITGWAQVNGWRGDTSIKERIRHDMYYIENWSLLLDIKILFMTAVKGFTNRNAY